MNIDMVASADTNHIGVEAIRGVRAFERGSVFIMAYKSKYKEGDKVKTPNKGFGIVTSVFGNVHEVTPMTEGKIYQYAEDELSFPAYKVGDNVSVYIGDDDYIPIHQGVVEGLHQYGYFISDTAIPVPESRLAKRISYLSPTSMALYESNINEFYMKYLARYRAEKIPQTQPMSVGSSFDAKVKSYIIEILARKKGVAVDPQYTHESLFHSQVEEHNKPWAWDNGLYVFDQYKKSGATADLLREIGLSEFDPRFEFEVRGTIEGVPLLGRPDLYYKTKLGAHVIVDWKVNGYCSKGGVSPNPGYVTARSTDGTAKQHPKARCLMVNGILCNVATYMEHVDKGWADQLATYAWLMGEPIGGDFICGLEQLACNGGGTVGQDIRSVSFRSGISAEYQRKLIERYKNCWHYVCNHDIDPLKEQMAINTRGQIAGSDMDWFNKNCR